MRAFITACMFAFSLHALPTVCFVNNDALMPAEISPGMGCWGGRYRPVVAQGSIVSITGDDLGPEGTVSTGSIGTELNGVSIEVRVGTVTLNAVVLSVQRRRIRVIIPSQTPQGDGTVTVILEGFRSAPYPIHVVGRSFRAYIRSLQAAAHNVSSAGTWMENRFTNPTRPGELLILWGSGLGDADATDIEAYAGLRPARVIYAGPSGCCPGVDQVVIETPSGIEGCTVPVILRGVGEELAEGLPTIAVSSQTGACSDPHGMPQAVRAAMEANGSARIGWVMIGPVPWWLDDGVYASFSRYATHYVVPPGTCGFPRWSAPNPQGSAFWDAGWELTFSGPTGDRQVPQHEDYNAELLGSIYRLPFDARDLPPGRYSVHNGGGGRDVGPFRIEVSVPGPRLTWTNRETLSAIRGQDVRLAWSATGSDDGFVRINGNFVTFRSAPNGIGLGGFSCLERVSRGVFTVPAWLAWTSRSNAAEVLQLQLTYFTQQEFSAPGLDYGEFTYTRQTDAIQKPIVDAAR